MPTLLNRITPQRVLIWLIIAGGIAAGPVIAYFLCTVGLPLVFITAGLLAVAAWALIARDRWWVPFPAALVLGGTFYYGFKIPMHEIALLVCLFPLILALATRWQGPIKGRISPAASVHLLTLYLSFHLMGSLIYNKLEGFGGAGNVTRNYMQCLWPMILFYFYYFFGNSKYARLSLTLMYIAVCFRVIIGIYMTFNPGLLYVPGINFIPSAGGASDFRSSCPAAVSIAICFFFMHKGRFLYRTLHILVIVICSTLVAFGSSRLSLVAFGILPLFLAFLYRQYLIIVVLGILMASTIILVNISPNYIEMLPKMTQRAASGFVFMQNNLEIKEKTELSDEYHARLQEAGRKRWLGSLGSILVGNGIRPLEMSEWESGSLDDMIKAANANSNYEAALWSILVRCGIVGFLLYLNVLFFLLRDSLPELWKNRLHDTQSSFSFMASYNLFVWLLLCPFAGAIPSGEIMMALFAKTLLDDNREGLKIANATSIPKTAVIKHHSYNS